MRFGIWPLGEELHGAEGPLLEHQQKKAVEGGDEHGGRVEPCDLIIGVKTSFSDCENNTF